MYIYRIHHAFDDMYTLRVYDDESMKLKSLVMSYLSTLENIMLEIKTWKYTKQCDKRA